MDTQRIRRLSARAAALAALAAALMLLPIAAPAQSVRMLIQSSPLAGFQYHEAPLWFDDMKTGDALVLRREPGNPYDSRAVQVLWHGHLLGYVPRTENQTLAWAMDRGDPLSARISRLRRSRNPRQRVEFEVFVE